MSDPRRRDPYVILGLPHGAPRDQIGRAFARATVAVRRGTSAWHLEDLTWAKQEAERAAEDSDVAEGFLRVPASTEALALQGGSALLTPEVHPLERTTRELSLADIAAVEQAVLNEAAITLLSDEQVFRPSAAEWVSESLGSVIAESRDPFHGVFARNEISTDADVATLRFRAGDPDPDVRADVAGLVTCPEDLLATLAQDEALVVRSAVAGNRKAAATILIGLCRDASPEVRRAAVGNPFLPAARCEQLLEDSDKQVAERALSRVVASIGEGVSSEDALKWSASPHSAIRVAVAQAPGTPTEVLVSLLRDKAAEVRDTASRELAPKVKAITDPAVLEAIVLATPTDAVLDAVLDNRSTPTKSVKILTGSKSPRIQARAAAILKLRRRRYRPWLIAGALAAGVLAVVVLVVMNQSGQAPMPATPSTPTPSPSPSASITRVVSVAVTADKDSFVVSWVSENGSPTQYYQVQSKLSSSSWENVGNTVQGSNTTVKVAKKWLDKLRKNKVSFRVGAVRNGVVDYWVDSEPIKLKKPE